MSGSSSSAVEFDRFVDANSRALQQSAWLMTGDWPAAEDLVQVALLHVWQRWDARNAQVVTPTDTGGR